MRTLIFSPVLAAVRAIMANRSAPVRPIARTLRFKSPAQGPNHAQGGTSAAALTPIAAALNLSAGELRATSTALNTSATALRATSTALTPSAAALGTTSSALTISAGRDGACAAGVRTTEQYLVPAPGLPRTSVHRNAVHAARLRSFMWAALAAVGCTGSMHAQDVRIAEVFGGGGNTGAPYNADYVVLMNRGTSPAVLTNWSVQYSSGSGTVWSLVGGAINTTIPGGGYYLIRGATGANGAALPSPDQTGATNLSGTNGKIALMNISTVIGPVTCPVGDVTFGPNVVDFVGYGTANCSETAAAPAGSNTTAIIRGGSGCVDTDSNVADFAAGTPMPKNSASARSECGPVGACCQSTGSCLITTTSGCSSGMFQGVGSTCDPNPCPQPTGACCVASVCALLTQSACTGAFLGLGAACDYPGNPVTCCRVNVNQTNGVTVQDIFDFLVAWFAGNTAVGNFNNDCCVSTQDIFDFLAAWFAGCN